MEIIDQDIVLSLNLVLIPKQMRRESTYHIQATIIEPL